MSRTEKVKLVLLGLVALGTTVTAIEVSRIAMNGFAIELTADEAKDIVDAYNAAIEDMEGEL